jgi:hypothetical protein
VHFQGIDVDYVFVIGAFVNGGLIDILTFPILPMIFRKENMGLRCFEWVGNKVKLLKSKAFDFIGVTHLK